jgi:hypothetical protein
MAVAELFLVRSMLRATCALVLVLAITASAAEFVIDRSDITSATADGASVILSLTPAKAAEWAKCQKDGVQVRLISPVPGKGLSKRRDGFHHYFSFPRFSHGG